MSLFSTNRYSRRFGRHARSRTKHSANAIEYLQLERRQLLACIEVSGAISEDTVWDSADGYCLIGDVVVEEGVILEVNSDLEFGGQTEHEIRVEGNLTFDQMRSGDLQIVVSPTGVFNVTNSELGCAECETSQFTVIVNGSLDVADSTWIYSNIQVNEDGLASLSGSELSSNSRAAINVDGKLDLLDVMHNSPVDVEVNGEFESRNTVFQNTMSEPMTITFVGQSTGFIHEGRLQNFRMQLRDDSVLVVDDAGIAGLNTGYSQIIVDSSLTIRNSIVFANEVIANDAELIFENNSISSLDLQSESGTLKFYESSFQYFELDISTTSTTEFKDNNFVRGTINLPGGMESFLWEGNEFEQSSSAVLHSQVSFSFNPDLLSRVIAGSTGLDLLEHAALIGTMTQDVVIEKGGDLWRHSARIRELTIKENASLTIGPGIRARGSIDVLGLLSAEQAELILVGTVRSGGTFNIVDSTTTSQTLAFEAGSQGLIQGSLLQSEFNIDSGSSIQFKSNYIDAAVSKATFVASGEPDKAIDMSGNFWNMNTERISQIITDQSDDPALPKINFDPRVIDSPLNQTISGTEGDDEILIELETTHLVLGPLTVTINGEPAEIDLSFMNRINFDGLGGEDSVTFKLNANRPAEVSASTHFGPTETLTKFFSGAHPLNREFVFAGFENTNVEFLAKEMLSNVTVDGTALDDEVVILHDSIALTNQLSTFSASGYETLTVDGGSGGNDTANVHVSYSGEAVYRDGEFEYFLSNPEEAPIFSIDNFEEITATAVSSNTQLTIWGTSGNDRLRRGLDWANLETEDEDTIFRTHKFDDVIAYGRGGNDTAQIDDQDQNDRLYSRPGQFYLDGRTTGLASTTLFGFSEITVESGTGVDSATLIGSEGEDEFFGNDEFSQLKTPLQTVTVRGFSKVTARSVGGNDSAFLGDSPEDDIFVASPIYSAMRNENFSVAAINFQSIIAQSTEGADVAHFSDSSGDDQFIGTPVLGRMTYEDGTKRIARDFANVYANASQGADHALFHDSAGDDEFVAKPTSALMTGTGYQHFALGFDSNSAISSGGNDVARFIDSSGNDSLFADSIQTRLKGEGFNNFTTGFRRNLIFSRGGNDIAYFTGSENNDFLGAKDNDVWMFNDDYFRFVNGFEIVEARANGGEINRANFVDLLFELELFGDWLT